MGLGGLCPGVGLQVGVCLGTPGGTDRGFYSGRQEMCMDLGYDVDERTGRVAVNCG